MIRLPRPLCAILMAGFSINLTHSSAADFEPTTITAALKPSADWQLANPSGTGTRDSLSPRQQFREPTENSGSPRNRRLTYHPFNLTKEALNELFTGENFKPSAIKFVDPSDSPEAHDGWLLTSDKLSLTNSRFGRRMALKSFRWLSSQEI